MDKNKDKSYDELLNLVTSLQKEIETMTIKHEKLSNDYEQLK